RALQRNIGAGHSFPFQINYSRSWAVLEKNQDFCELFIIRKYGRFKQFPAAKCRNRQLILHLEELSHVAELLVTRGEQLRNGNISQTGKVFLQGGIQQGGGGFMISLRSTFGLGN